MFGQDIMVLKNSDEIKSKIVELTDFTIKYKKWENLNGPIYNINKRDVLFIRYENGFKEVISPIPNSSIINPEVEKNPFEPEIEEIDVQDSKIRKKRIVRLSWDIANLELFDDGFTDYGIGSEGFNSRLDIGFKVFEKNNLELGLNLNVLGIGIHQGASSYNFALELEKYITSQTGEYWWASDWSSGELFINGTNSIGIYAVKNLNRNAVKFGLNYGIMSFSEETWDCTLKNWNNDRLRSVAYIDFGIPSFINPNISIFFGKPKSKVRWSINLDYKWMYIQPTSDGWVELEMINGGYDFQITPTTWLDSKTVNVFNLGIGVTGF